jgi:hypothetical protein
VGSMGSDVMRQVSALGTLPVQRVLAAVDPIPASAVHAVTRGACGGSRADRRGSPLRGRFPTADPSRRLPSAP